MTRALVVIGLVCMSSPAWAQINPYAAPYPGAVLIQPCGQEAGWVPASHPAATDPRSFCVAQIPPPSPDQPWTLSPEMPFQVGAVYRNPYGTVLDVVSATVVYRRNADSRDVEPRVMSIQALMYQSRWHYDARQGAEPVDIDPQQERGVWWEVAP